MEGSSSPPDIIWVTNESCPEALVHRCLEMLVKLPLLAIDALVVLIAINAMHFSDHSLQVIFHCKLCSINHVIILKSQIELDQSHHFQFQLPAYWAFAGF